MHTRTYCGVCECPAFRPRLRDLARRLYARLWRTS